MKIERGSYGRVITRAEGRLWRRRAVSRRAGGGDPGGTGWKTYAGGPEDRVGEEPGLFHGHKDIEKEDTGADADHKPAAGPDEQSDYLGI